jgi:predicted metal-dependent enzyme (double-stranded beta helix superfamily)
MSSDSHDSHKESFDRFCVGAAATLLAQAPLSHRLREVAAQLVALTRELAGPLPPHWLATAGQSLLEPLAIDRASGLALYRVSENGDEVDPPHGHQTWAVTAGIVGAVRHRLYRRTALPGEVEWVRDVVVAPGESLVLLEHEVHSTERVAAGPTLHLHLYGKPLESLPPLAQRSFLAIGRPGD